MKTPALNLARIRKILAKAAKLRVLVLGDVMLDQFIWGNVSRISPEAPVPVVEFSRENFMPGGAANVARNIAAFNAGVDLMGIIGVDDAGRKLCEILRQQAINGGRLVKSPVRHTTIKTRIVAHQQQVVRIDRESVGLPDKNSSRLLASRFDAAIHDADAVIVGDYGKGVVSQPFLDQVKAACRKRGIWLSLDPKPVHQLNLTGLSLITPNRREAFQLAGLADDTRTENPLKDPTLAKVSERLLRELRPAVLLITLGELGMLLCQRDAPPFHIPTVAQEVFDVSGAGDTVISVFTLAIASGASPLEASILSNHAAGIVVGKVGTATTSPAELLKSF